MEQLFKLEKMLVYIRKDCIGNALFEALVKSGKTIDISIGSMNKYFFDDNDITLKDNAYIDNLFHEMLHAYQALNCHSATYWNNKSLNSELEVALMRHNFRNRNEKLFEKITYSSDDYADAVNNLRAIVNEDGTFVSNIPDMNRDHINDAVESMRKAGYTESNKYFYNSSASVGSIFSNMKNLFINCDLP